MRFTTLSSVALFCLALLAGCGGNQSSQGGLVNNDGCEASFNAPDSVCAFTSFEVVVTIKGNAPNASYDVSLAGDSNGATVTPTKISPCPTTETLTVTAGDSGELTIKVGGASKTVKVFANVKISGKPDPLWAADSGALTGTSDSSSNGGDIRWEIIPDSGVKVTPTTGFGGLVTVTADKETAEGSVQVYAYDKNDSEKKCGDSTTFEVKVCRYKKVATDEEGTQFDIEPINDRTTFTDTILEHYKALLAQAQADLIAAQARLAAAQAAYDAADKAYDDLERDNRTATRALERQLEGLRSQLNDATTRMGQIDAQIARLEADMAALDPSQTAQRAALAEQLGKAKEEKAALQQSIDATNAKITTAETELAALEQALETARAARLAALQALRDVKAEIDNLKLLIQGYQDQIADRALDEDGLHIGLYYSFSYQALNAYAVVTCPNCGGHHDSSNNFVAWYPSISSPQSLLSQIIVPANPAAGSRVEEHELGHRSIYDELYRNKYIAAVAAFSKTRHTGHVHIPTGGTLKEVSDEAKANLRAAGTALGQQVQGWQNEEMARQSLYDGPTGTDHGRNQDNWPPQGE